MNCFRTYFYMFMCLSKNICLSFFFFLFLGAVPIFPGSCRRRGACNSESPTTMSTEHVTRKTKLPTHRPRYITIPTMVCQQNRCCCPSTCHTEKCLQLNLTSRVENCGQRKMGELHHQWVDCIEQQGAEQPVVFMTITRILEIFSPST